MANTSIIDFYYQQAGIVEQKTGWDRDVVMALWEHETGNFTSQNFRQNNNLGGQTWTPSMGIASRGTARPSNEGGYYVKYPSASAGFIDFITKNSRYAKVPFITTEEGQIDAIANAGWAVDPNWRNGVKQHLKQNKAQGMYNGERAKWVGSTGASTDFFGTASKLLTIKSDNDVSLKSSYDDMEDGASTFFLKLDEFAEFNNPNWTDIASPVEFLGDNGKALGTRLIIVLIGLIIFIFGFVQMNGGF